MNVLVVAAHPDDEVLGCGGTIARLSQEGHSVQVVILGEGITARSAVRSDASLGAIGDLHSASREVARALGAQGVELLSFPDNRFDSVDLLDIVKPIESAIERFQPEIVYTHYGGDLNVDHALTFRAVMTATRPMVDCGVREVCVWPTLSSTEWAFGRLGVFAPNVFVNIENFLSQKVLAMKMYVSEVREYPHPRSPEVIEHAARLWGSVVGNRASEPFELVRAIR